MKVIFVLLGFTALILGIIGIIVPGLPTTPFLLLALYCFGKSSERLNQWFLSTSIYRKYLQNYAQTRAMTLKQKAGILACSAPFCLFAFFSLPNIFGKIALVAVVIVQYYYFIFKIKTLEN
ncbi:YbaN family protein [Glaesserella sp.]|uniref:YbaN family protein n=1 Tax=Glaesserella sp. TaxID=2094731 RepID=UPI0035A0C0A5